MKFYDFFGCKFPAYVPSQFMRIMKLIIIIMTTLLVQVSAKTMAQRITMKAGHSNLKKVFSEIRKQSGFIVLYKSDQLNNTKPLDINIDNVPLEEAMKEILKGQGLSFIIKDKSIIIIEKEKTTTEDRVSLLEDINIRGKIVNEQNEPLPGASIKVVSTGQVTLTNAEGTFVLQKVNENTILQISFIGYETKEVKAVSNMGSIILTQLDAKLNEVVVMGYSTQKRTNVTGSVVTLQAKDIENSSVSNPLQSLQGKTPGLQITQGSGQPGAEGISLNIRGPNSFASDNGPLILINGVVGDINALDPSFIESVTVLKDASAAIYGARASNGVILVTTKTGAEDSKLHIDLNSSYLNQASINTPERVWNSVDYMNMRNTAIKNGGGGATPYDQSIIDLYKTPSEQYPNFNWEDYMIKPVNIFNNTLSVGGSSGNTNYHGGMGVWSQDGIVRGFDYKKYTGMFSMDSRVSKRFKFGISLNGIIDQTKQPYNGVADMILATLSQAPTYGPFLLDGSGRVAWRAWDAEWPQKPPFAVSENGGNWNNRFLFNGTAYTQVKILDNLTWEVKGGMRATENSAKLQTPVIPIYNWITGEPEGYSNGTQTIDLRQQTDLSKYYTAYSTLDYTKTFLEDFNLDVLLGISEEKSVGTMLNGYRRGFASSALDVLNAAPEEGQTTGGTETEYSLRSLFSRITLNYKSKYLFEGNVRRDGSSRFPPSYKYAYFPSFLAGWRISQEPFITEKLPWINELKLRASYGTLGNDNVNGNYPYQSTLSTGANYPFADQGGVRLGNLANERLKWEETSTKNIGLDFLIKNSLLYGNLDYFVKTTTGILRPQQVPGYSGVGSPSVNQGTVDNKGFEVVLGHRQRVGQVDYGVEGNFSRYKNTLRNFGAPAYNGNTFMKEGYEINRYFMYQGDGIYQSQTEIDNGPSTPWVQTPGDVRIKDVDGNGIVNADDRVDVDGVNPSFYYGMNLYANWNGFDIAVLFQGEQGRKVLVNSEYDGILPFSGGNVLAWWQDSWTPENHSTTKPRMDYYYGPNGGSTRAASTFWLKDISYLRLKNVTLGYTLPAELVSKIALQKVRFYANAQNLLTFTKYKFGDPENVGGRAYPMLRTLTFGLNVQF